MWIQPGKLAFLAFLPAIAAIFSVAAPLVGEMSVTLAAALTAVSYAAAGTSAFMAFNDAVSSSAAKSSIATTNAPPSQGSTAGEQCGRACGATNASAIPSGSTAGVPLPEDVVRILEEYFPGFPLDTIRVFSRPPNPGKENQLAWIASVGKENHINVRNDRFPRSFISAGGIARLGHEIVHLIDRATIKNYPKLYRRELELNGALRRKNSDNPYEIGPESMERRIFNDLLIKGMPAR
jgi:hypothetical protein